MSVAATMIEPAAQPPDQAAPSGMGSAPDGVPPPIPPVPPAAPKAAPDAAPAGQPMGAESAQSGSAGRGAGGVPPPWAWTPPAGPSVVPGLAGRMVDPTVTDEQKTYAMLIHLSLLLCAVAPFLSVLAPIIMWQVKKADSPFLDDHGREAVNFHLTVLLYGVCSFVLMFVVIGIPLLVGVNALAIVGIILSSIAAKRGEYYRYPMCLRFLK